MANSLSLTYFLMANSLKVQSSWIGQMPQQAGSMLALPRWLSSAAICSPLANMAASINKPAGWQLRLESNSSNAKAKKRARSPAEPLPGRFYFGNEQIPFALDSSLAGAFVFWLPEEIETSDLQLVASSRLPRRLLDNPLLLDSIRSVAASLLTHQTKLLYSPQFTLASHLRALSRKFQIPLLQLSSIPARANKAWFRKKAKQPRHMPGAELFYYFLPTLNPADNFLAELPAESFLHVIAERLIRSEGIPDSVVDWLAVHLAHRVHLISLRPGGNLEVAVRHRLRIQSSEPLSVRLLEASQLTPMWLVDQVAQAGATRWKIAPTACSMSLESSRLQSPSERTDSVPLICEAEPNGDFLFHWTRAAELNRGKSTDELLTKLILANQRPAIGETEFGCDVSCRSQWERLLMSLLQILAEMRLRASGRWTRDRRPVVSLTAQPLALWRELRSFRSHLGRWDFEPCGLGLSRELIHQLGGRPVVYGDEQTYTMLAAAEQTYFQLANSRGPNRAIDWTVEREWRVPDDIDLRKFGERDAFVFVPNRDAAIVAAQLSRWPIYTLDRNAPEKLPVSSQSPV